MLSASACAKLLSLSGNVIKNQKLSGRTLNISVTWSGIEPLRAQYEAAVLQRQHHIAQLEEYVLDTYPAFKVQNDPINQKAPAVLAALFRKKVVKSRKDDAGLLRYSTNQEVLMKLGDMTDLHPLTTPHSRACLHPDAEVLRRRFEGQQIQNSQRLISH